MSIRANEYHTDDPIPKHPRQRAHATVGDITAPKECYKDLKRKCGEKSVENYSRLKSCFDTGCSLWSWDDTKVLSHRLNNPKYISMIRL